VLDILTEEQGMQTGDFVLVGYSVSEAAEGLAALALGEWHDSELFYRGKVGTGFDAVALRKIGGHQSSTSPYIRACRRFHTAAYGGPVCFADPLL
jgi:ATP-dependent DNA ligase